MGIKGRIFLDHMQPDSSGWRVTNETESVGFQDGTCVCKKKKTLRPLPLSYSTAEPRSEEVGSLNHAVYTIITTVS